MRAFRLVRADRGSGRAARRDRPCGRPARGRAAERGGPALAPAIDPGRRCGLDDLARGARDDMARRGGLRIDQYRRCGGGPRQDRRASARSWPSGWTSFGTNAPALPKCAPVAAIDVELQKAQPEAQAVWRITDGCRDVTRPASARACATVLELRQAHAAAARRDAIDAELRDVQSKLSALPAVATADPQATTAAEMVVWLSAGAFNPAPDRRCAAARARPCADAVARRADRDAGDGAGAAGLIGSCTYW